MQSKNRYRIHGWLIALLFLFPARTLFANVTVAAIFSDHMVLQQKSRVPVWGWAQPRETITLQRNWDGETMQVKADGSGNWHAFLQTPKAGGPYTLTISGQNTITIQDVMIGEVWVCSGQSNMVFSLKGSADAQKEIASANLPNIRYFSVKRQYGNEESKDCAGSNWELTSPATAPGFSAVAYYFAKKIQHDLNVPVGIIYSAWGGTPAEAWTAPAALAGDDVLKVYFDRWKKIQQDVGKDSAAYHVDLDKWQADSSKSKKPGEPQTLYYFKRPWREPGVLFNGMISPVIPYAVKGILWYQGESNVSYADEYYQLLSLMIRDWRQRWFPGTQQKDLPFYFVQIAPYGYGNLDAAARLRDGQYRVSNSVPNTGMAVTVDLGNMKDIHYTHKKEAGERLAFIALHDAYGNRKQVYKGPECIKATLEQNKAILEFAAPTSLVIQKGTELNGFELGYAAAAGDSLVYRKANARIVGNTIEVWTDNTAAPQQVRYAWLLAGEANLVNKEGLPAFPFTRPITK